MVDILGGLMPQIASKALRPLAVLGAQRAPQLPGVPAVRESGGVFTGFNVTSWNGLAVPARTPAAVVDRLSREVNAALAQNYAALRARLVAAAEAAAAALNEARDEETERESGE